MVHPCDYVMGNIRHKHKNPLRAAAIVYLMIKEGNDRLYGYCFCYFHY